MSRKPLLKISESEVVALWQDHIIRQRAVTDSEGENFEIVYPGRTNDGRGNRSRKRGAGDCRNAG